MVQIKPVEVLAPQRVEGLDVEALPQGTKTRLLLEIAHDGLGRPFELPVIVVRGARPGPVFGITAAVHGNELNGIPVLHRLLDRIDPAQLRGSVVAVMVVNIPGFLAHERRFFESADLNHVMPGRPDGNSAQVYAYRLLDRVVRHFDYLVDMHTASFGRVNSLYVRADMGDPRAARMARLQRPQIILDDPPSDHTLRGAAAELNIPAITVEIGDPQRFQAEYISRSVAGVRAVLSEVKMLPRRKPTPLPPPVICARSTWLYTDHGGLLEVFPVVTAPIEQGEVVARLSNIFGDVVREYRAPFSGVVIGKSVNPVSETGGRILHLGLLHENQELWAEPDPDGPDAGMDLLEE